MKIISSNKGVSIIAAIFTLIILGIFGALIVTLVSTEQETRIAQLTQDWAFYNAQAGLEYGLRQVDTGGEPEVTNKPFGKGAFTINVDFVEGSKRDMIVTGTSGASQRTFTINYDSFGGDCLSVNNDQVVMTGPGKTELKGLTLTRNCNDVITIDRIGFLWTPDNVNEKVIGITIKNDLVWSSISGIGSGEIADITDTPITGSVAHQINQIDFSHNMLNKELTLVFYLSDTSSKTITFTILPPNS